MKSLLKKYRIIAVPSLILVGLILWWMPYFLHGWLPMSEWGYGLIWGDWLSDRYYLVSQHIIPEWNPNYVLGENYIGRDPFNNPLSLGNIFKLFFSDPKHEWIAALFFYLLVMGIGFYKLLRNYNMSRFVSILGAILITIFPKCMDDIYHGPGKFVAAYSVVPWFMLTAKAMFTARPRMIHFILLGIFGAVIFLGSGGWVAILVSYLIIPYFFYCWWNYSQKMSAVQTIRTGAGIVLSCVIALGLSAYLLLPLLDSLKYASRSLYSPPVGYGLFDLCGLVFPWSFRLYTDGYYDLPVMIPGIGPSANVRSYFGILTIPLFIYAIMDKELRKKYGFFWMWPIVIVILFSKIGNRVIPIVHWFESHLNAQSTENFQFFGLFLCCSTISMAGLNKMFSANAGAGYALRNDDVVPSVIRKVSLAMIVFYISVLFLWVVMFFIIHFWPACLNFLSSYPLFQGDKGLMYFIGLQLVIYSYFFDVFFYLILASLTIRVVILWWFSSKRFIRRKAGFLILAILIISDFLLIPRIIYPFTSSLDIRYSSDISQNKFIGDSVKPYERVGASQMSEKINHKLRSFGRIMKDKYSEKRIWDPPDYFRQFRNHNPDQGYFQPLFDIGVSYYPVTLGKQIYNYHASFLPDYFYDFDRILNESNKGYSRQSWNAVWDPTSPLIDIAGISYIFWYAPLEDDRFELVGRYPIGDGYIYRNKRAVPKAYVVKRLEYFEKRDDLLNRMKEKTFQPLNIVTTEDQELRDALKNIADDKGEASEDSVRIISYEPNRIVIDATASSPSVLVVTDLFFPHWMAHVDGEPARIFRVNGVFRGLIIGPGAHKVQMDYRNEPFHRGLKISLATLIILSCLFAFVVYRERRQTL